MKLVKRNAQLADYDETPDNKFKNKTAIKNKKGRPRYGNADALGRPSSPRKS